MRKVEAFAALAFGATSVGLFSYAQYLRLAKIPEGIDLVKRIAEVGESVADDHARDPKHFPSPETYAKGISDAEADIASARDWAYGLEVASGITLVLAAVLIVLATRR